MTDLQNPIYKNHNGCRNNAVPSIASKSGHGALLSTYSIYSETSSIDSELKLM